MLAASEVETLRRLEESLWVASTRFDTSHMADLLADDFVEFGRSGRIYSKAEIINAPPCSIAVTLPLPNFSVQTVDQLAALVTYDSHVESNGSVLSAHRSSIWSKANGAWQLLFHQGTPFDVGT